MLRVEFYQGDERNLVRRLSSWVVDIAVALAFAWLPELFWNAGYGNWTIDAAAAEFR